MAHNQHFRLCSINMHGFNNGHIMAKSICIDYDIILLQEHWLLRDNVSKLGEMDADFFLRGGAV